MRWALDPHPETPGPFIESLEVGLVREQDTLSLVYDLSGDIDRLRIPDPAPAKRRDGLWQRTCFEAFVRPEGTQAYCEFNFSPSSEWAAYRLERYREHMQPLMLKADPEVVANTDRSRLQLWARLELGDLDMLAGQTWHIGLTAVVAATTGDKSYWALDHAPGRPDFHHADCFALELPPPTHP